MASRELYQLLLQAQSDASSSQLASLLQQREMLKDSTRSSTYIANTHHLNDKYEVHYHFNTAQYIFIYLFMYRLGEGSVSPQIIWSSSRAFHLNLES